MSRTFYVLERLEPPFRNLAERSMLIARDTQQTVSAIARDCGFSSTTLFCRNFKQYTDSTLLAYRDEFGAKAEL